MNIKRVLVLSAVPLILGGVGFTVSSKAVASQSILLAQNSTQPTGQQQGKKGHQQLFSQLGLSDAQQAEIKRIKESTHQQMAAIFTAEQKQQMQTGRQQRQRPNLNLTDDQKAKLKALRESSKSQIDAVLTPEQKQKLDELKQQWRQNHPNRQNRQPQGQS